MPLSVLRGIRLPGERWTVQDQLLAVALQVHDDDLCPGCGQPRAESMAAGAQKVGGSADYYYEAPPPLRCHSCDEVAVRVDAVAEAKLQRPHALQFSSVRRDRSGRKVVTGADVRG